MTPRELFLLAPHLRLWNAQIERAKAAYDRQPIASTNGLWCITPDCMRRRVARGLCRLHYNAEYESRRRKPAP